MLVNSRTVGNCDSGYSCAYTNSISWRTPTTPMPPEVNPRMMFERLFGTVDLSLDPETRGRLRLLLLLLRSGIRRRRLLLRCHRHCRQRDYDCEKTNRHRWHGNSSSRVQPV